MVRFLSAVERLAGLEGRTGLGAVGSFQMLRAWLPTLRNILLLLHRFLILGLVVLCRRCCDAVCPGPRGVACSG